MRQVRAIHLSPHMGARSTAGPRRPELPAPVPAPAPRFTLKP
nr:hypothetical protein [Streptomyces corallincola]